MIRAGGATHLPIGHGLDVLEEQPQATKPTVPDRDSSSDISVDMSRLALPVRHVPCRLLQGEGRRALVRGPVLLDSRSS